MFERLTKYAGKLADRNMNVEFGGGTFGPVSYTHLTLPTTSRV